MVTLNELKQEAFRKPGFKKEYDALEDEFKLIEALVDMRQKAALTQEEVAQKMGVHKSVVCRLQSEDTNPSWKMLQRYADACGFKVYLQYSGSLDSLFGESCKDKR